jgi:uncharacterized protein (DUF302 family)
LKPHVFSVERVDVTTRRPFVDVVAAFERKVPAGDVATFNRLAQLRATAGQIEEVVQGMVGELGLMVLGRLEQGALASLLGKPKKLTTFLIGNPVLANRMFERDPAVGAYAPLRATIYEDYSGITHFSYERPSTLLAQFDDEEISAVGQILDEKMSNLAAHLVA